MMSHVRECLLTIWDLRSAVFAERKEGFDVVAAGAVAAGTGTGSAGGAATGCPTTGAGGGAGGETCTCAKGKALRVLRPALRESSRRRGSLFLTRPGIVTVRYIRCKDLECMRICDPEFVCGRQAGCAKCTVSAPKSGYS
jgi:hypothetical protein